MIGNAMTPRSEVLGERQLSLEETLPRGTRCGAGGLVHQLLEIAPASDRHIMAAAAVGSAVLLVIAATVQAIAL